MKETFILKGDICYSGGKQELITKVNHYVVCVNGISKGVYENIPEEYKGIPLYDYASHMIIPGLVDLHLHAPQYSFRGMAMDMELLDWLDTKTFPEESKYEDMNYAKKAYDIFVRDIKHSATTRANIFATLHVPSTLYLMEELELSGLAGYVGKVNMDRNSPDILCEKNSQESLKSTLDWLKRLPENIVNIKPILTPRFIPTCSEELMNGLSELQKRYNLPVQSHLSENLGEIAWVRELCPDSSFYGEAYESYGMFGKGVMTVMAHCVHSGQEEIKRMKDNGVYIAHCPQSNVNLSSGIAPVRAYLEEDLCIGLGTDIAGGSSLSVFRAMTDTIQVSKLRWRLSDTTQKPITVPEAFYMGTKGGGSFFGKVGSFEEGYEMDALVLDESKIPHPFEKLGLSERLERFLYLSREEDVIHKFVKGKQLF